MTDRAILMSVTSLMAAREAGSYTLPDDLVKTFDLWTELRATTVPAAEAPNLDRAGGLLVNRALEGKPIDLIAATEGLVAEKAAHDRDQLAARLAHEAIEIASARVVSVARDVADTIILKHLRPRYEQTMSQARKLVPSLAGASLTTEALITGPAKVREAWQAMRELDHQRSVLVTARGYANKAGERNPQQDTNHEFSTLRKPRALFPGLADTAATPRNWGIPDEPVARMLWFLADAQPAEPWLPTVVDQDQAWEAVYGEAHRKVSAAGRGWARVL